MADSSPRLLLMNMSFASSMGTPKRSSRSDTLVSGAMGNRSESWGWSLLKLANKKIMDRQIRIFKELSACPKR